MKKLSLTTQIEYTLKRYLSHFFRIDFDQRSLQEKIIRELNAQGGKGKKLKIDKLTQISDAYFRSRYLLPGTPMIFKGAAKNWDCRTKWSFDYFKQQFGNDQLNITNTLESEHGTYPVSQGTISEMIDYIHAGDTTKYARFNGLLHLHPELLNDIDQKFILSKRNILKSGNSYQLFMGAKGTKTLLHAAPAHNLFVQVKGTKKWFLYPANMDAAVMPKVNGSPYYSTSFDPGQPDFEKYPCIEYLDYFEFELEEGDILYNPSSWWHYVENLTPNIGFGFRWFGLLSSPQLNLSQVLLTILAYNPSLFFTLRNKRDYSKIFEKIHNKVVKQS